MNPLWGRALTIEQALFMAQNARCFYCNTEFAGPPSKRNKRKCWTRDHLRPWAQGHGKTLNIVLACGDCNQAKGDRPATELQLNLAVMFHKRALEILAAYNGCVPPEWTGDRKPTPTIRAMEMAGAE